MIFYAAPMYTRCLPSVLSHRAQCPGTMPLLWHCLSPNSAGSPITPGYIWVFHPGRFHRYAECRSPQCFSRLPGMAVLLPASASGSRVWLIPVGCPGILPAVPFPGNFGGHHHQLGCPAAASGVFPDMNKTRILTIPYLNHAYDQLDEQSTPVLRGAGKIQLDPAGIPAGEICFLTVMKGRKAETANRKPVSQNCSHQKVQPFRAQQ